jgi:ribosomal protein S12
VNIIQNKVIQKRLINSNKILTKLHQELLKLPESNSVIITKKDLELLLSQCKKPNKEIRKLIKQRFSDYY